MIRCSCGSPAIQCRRNLSKPRAIRAGSSSRTTIAFETAIEQHVLAPRYGWPIIPLERHRCTMAHVVWRCGLPARLSAAADALELANRKDAAGERLMHQMSKPRRPRKDEDPAGTYWFDDRGSAASGSTTIAGKTSKSSVSCSIGCRRCRPSEQALWVLSSRINERGFCVDRQFAEAARRIAQAAAPEIDAELAEITGGAVTGINQIARLLQWLQQQGCTAAEARPQGDREAAARYGRSAAGRCSACSSCGSAVHRPPSRRSTRCLLVPVMTIVCAAPFAITAPPPAAGPVKVSSRRT